LRKNMPANLTPDYHAAEKRYKEAGTPEEKLRCLQEMLSVIPKHKGTDKLQGDIKHKIAKLKGQTEKRKGAARRTDEYHIDKEGAGQIALVGLPNVGKSSLVDQLTNASPEVADFPFTTRKPLPAMMKYEDVQAQLIDTPPISDDYFESWLPGLLRLADTILLVVDCQKEPLVGVETIVRLLREKKILLVKDPAAVELDKGEVAKRTIVVANKADEPDARDNFEILEEFFGQEFPLILVSAESGENLEILRYEAYSMLGKLRVYSKLPGKEADMAAPFVFKKGTTVFEMAEYVHKDIAKRLKYARIWGSEKYDGQMVNRDYILQDRDIIELHM